MPKKGYGTKKLKSSIKKMRERHKLHKERMAAKREAAKKKS